MNCVIKEPPNAQIAANRWNVKDSLGLHAPTNIIPKPDIICDFKAILDKIFFFFFYFLYLLTSI